MVMLKKTILSWLVVKPTDICRRRYRLFPFGISALTSLFITLSSVTTLKAETLDWQDVDGGRVRLAFDGAQNIASSNYFYGLIEIELQSGWKTYWKNPGNSGMAPELEFDQPFKADMLFPAPHLFQNGSDWAYGYKDKVLIPFRLAKDNYRQGKISGKLLIGVCNALCIPAEIPFAFNNPQNPDFLTKGRIQAALSALPVPANHKFSLVETKPDAKHLTIALESPQSGEIPQLFLDAGNTQLGIAKMEKQSDGSVTYSVPVLSGELKSGQTIDYTAVAANNAVSGTIIAP